MADLHNISINEVFKLGGLEFLNWWAYMKEKRDDEEQQIRDAKELYSKLDKYWQGIVDDLIKSLKEKDRYVSGVTAALIGGKGKNEPVDIFTVKQVLLKFSFICQSTMLS